MYKKDDFERYLKKQLKNPKFKEEWDKLAEEYDELKKTRTQLHDIARSWAR